MCGNRCRRSYVRRQSFLYFRHDDSRHQDAGCRDEGQVPDQYQGGRPLRPDHFCDPDRLRSHEPGREYRRFRIQHSAGDPLFYRPGTLDHRHQRIHRADHRLTSVHPGRHDHRLSDLRQRPLLHGRRYFRYVRDYDRHYPGSFDRGSDAGQRRFCRHPLFHPQQGGQPARRHVRNRIPDRLHGCCDRKQHCCHRHRRPDRQGYHRGI